MDISETILVISRVLERNLIIILAGFSLWMGWNLFRKGIGDPQVAELEMNNLTVRLQRIGPGVFFALFGAFILWQGQVNILSYSPFEKAIKEDQDEKVEVEDNQSLMPKTYYYYGEKMGNEGVEKLKNLSIAINTLNGLNLKIQDAKKLQMFNRAMYDIEEMRDYLVQKKVGSTAPQK